MNYSEEHLDQLLEASGEQWRASEPQLEPFSVATLLRQGEHRATTNRRVLAVAPLAAVLLVTGALLALFVVGPLGAPVQTVAPTPSASPNLEGLPGYIAPAEAAGLIEQCGVSGTIDAYFRIPAGQTYKTVFPHAGLAPEMDGAIEPFVVIYSGNISFVSTVPLPSMHNAVCMFSADGNHNIYPDLPLADAQLPPGAYLRTPSTLPSPPPSIPPSISCQPYGYSPAPITFEFAHGAATAASAEQTAVALIRSCAATPDESSVTVTITSLASNVKSGTGEPMGPNAGQAVWLVQIDTTETVKGGAYQAHYWVEVNQATGVPTLVAYG